ncbi:MAG TPA: TetR/AcrR family transcriptional regulator [Bryobacteraceae bacterium]|nr:TetR/AcrR family transcriptional regulator [Bryobacteraceae bacterium]
MERRARHKTELKRQILDAAREVFITEGYRNVSMRKIAERIEYSPTTIYLYFRDKADLLRSLTEETFAKLAESFERITKDNGDGLERLRKGLRAYVEFGLNNPNDYRVAFLLEHEPLVAGGGHLDETSMAHRAYSFLRGTVQDCVEQQRFRQVDIETASQSLWAAAHGLTALLIVHPEFPWARQDELIDCLIENTINGFRPQQD